MFDFENSNGFDLRLRPSLVDDIAPEALSLANIFVSRFSRPLGLVGTVGTMESVWAAACSAHQAGWLSPGWLSMIHLNVDASIGQPPEDPNSYPAYMKFHYYDYVPVPAENRFIPNGMAQNFEEECERINTILDMFGPAHLLLTGSGKRGHIAFNEGIVDPSLRTHVSKLDIGTLIDNSRYYNNDLDQVPPTAFTVGMHDILAAGKIIVILNKGKDEAAFNLLDTEGEWTAIRHLRNHPNATIFIEENAFPYSPEVLREWKSLRNERYEPR